MNAAIVVIVAILREAVRVACRAMKGINCLLMRAIGTAAARRNVVRLLLRRDLRERFVEQPDAFVHVGLGDVHRRGHADHVAVQATFAD